MITKPIPVNFTSAGVPQVGLTPTITIYHVNTTDPTLSTIVVAADPVPEIGLGWYCYLFTTYDPAQNYVFTIDGGAILADCDRYKVGGNESYSEDTTEVLLNEPLSGYTITGSVGDTITKIKADTATLIINDVTFAALLQLLVKYQRNRTRIDTTAATLTLYDDDCTTPLWVWDLKDFNGMPSVQEVCDRVPQICPEPPVP